MRALGLFSSESRPKGHDTHKALIFFRLKDYALLVGKNTMFQDPKYGELEIINAHMSQCVCDA